jgi:FtsZ-binding cell division protein ZapB
VSYCLQCGAALDVLEHIATRRAESTAERITRRQSEMTPLKEEAERASQERLEKMWAKDHARMEALAEAKTKQEWQERLLWIIAAAAIVALLIGIVALAVIAQFRAH